MVGREHNNKKMAIEMEVKICKKMCGKTIRKRERDREQANRKVGALSNKGHIYTSISEVGFINF